MKFMFFSSSNTLCQVALLDRGTYVTIAKLKEAGVKEVTLDSSGNAALV